MSTQTDRVVVPESARVSTLGGDPEVRTVWVVYLTGEHGRHTPAAAFTSWNSLVRAYPAAEKAAAA